MGSRVINYLKVITIIDSCVTLEQLKYAERYVGMFEQVHEIDGHSVIGESFKKLIFSKKMKLKNGWNNKD